MSASGLPGLRTAPPFAPRVAGWLGAAILAAGVGAAAVIAPLPAALAALGIAVILAVAWHPPVAAYLLLATTPLLVGIDRDQLLPVLRPSEAVLGLVAVAVVLRLVVMWRAEADGHIRPTRVDAAITFLAVSGSLLPLLWMTIRARPISHDDVLYALVLWKFYAVFVIIRICIRNEAQVARCLWVVLGASSVVAVIGIAQSLGVGPVIGFLNQYYSPLGEGALVTGRASSTMGSSFSVADVMTFCIAISGAWLLGQARYRTVLLAMSVLFVLAAVASGEFSALIGLVVAALSFGYLVRRFGRVLVGLVGSALVAFVVLQPVIQARLNDRDASSGLPSSWLDRLHNLQKFFWPDLFSHYNWLTGVRPTTQLRNPQNRLRAVWIESGHTWLLWTGGIVMLVAFFVYLVVTMTSVAKVARIRSDAIGVAAIASFTALAVTAVLMTFDPHLSLRGSADLSFALLALALTGSRAPPVGA